MKTQQGILYLMLLAGLLVSPAMAQHGGGRGPGFGRGRGRGHDERHNEDRDVFHFLLANHKKIRRNVKELSNGVETLTESDDPTIASKIKEHVKWMQYRVEETKRIRMRDPLFAELFRHTDKIKMDRVETKKGVRVTETSEDAYVAKLILAHAKAVSGFVDRGFDEAMKNHPVPSAATDNVVEYSRPAITGYGKVARLPSAAQQPRSGSKIVVDVTKGGDSAKLNPGLENVARFVNIYRGAGKDPADAEITIVLHGDATLAVLNTDVYSKRFRTKSNPNFDCLRKLHEADVQILVCGQSLLGKNASPADVVVFADVAVSALTSLVNLQADGFSYVPLVK